MRAAVSAGLACLGSSRADVTKAHAVVIELDKTIKAMPRSGGWRSPPLDPQQKALKNELTSFSDVNHLFDAIDHTLAYLRSPAGKSASPATLEALIDPLRRAMDINAAQ